MSDLNKILDRCKCGVSLMVNEYKNVYQTIDEAVEELFSHGNEPDIHPEVLAEILSTGNLVELQFYPDTPVGFYLVHHYDVDQALAEAVKILEE